uniref:Haloacid dehalogenase-like hydrolase domain-containing protein 3 n=1 Tax=Calcidiscus leptoporus TaxID=127549 RepID=A0A7S0J3C1_9EUKA
MLVACRACVTSARRVQGVCVGAVTDGNTDVSRAAAVGELFDFAVTAADAGSSKSAVPPYLQAAHASGHRPTSIVHVGDSISKDLCGALRCGYRAVWLEREGRSPSAEEQLALPPADEGRWTRARSLHDVLRVLLPEVESAGH